MKPRERPRKVGTCSAAGLRGGGVATEISSALVPWGGFGKEISSTLTFALRRARLLPMRLQMLRGLVSVFFVAGLTGEVMAGLTGADSHRIGETRDIDIIDSAQLISVNI